VNVEQQKEQEFIAERLATCRRLLSRLVHFDAPANGEPGEAYNTVTEFAAELLRVARVGVWRLEPDGKNLICADLFDARIGSHRSGGVISEALAPSYFRALTSLRCIAAVDARADPATAEFEHTYLEPNGIGALLDAPIWVDGRLAGVICHEHIGGPRRWTFGDELLAGSMADFLARVLENVERRRAERALGAVRHSEHNFRALLAAAPVALLLAAGNDQRVVAVNQRAATMLAFGPGVAKDPVLRDLLADGADWDALETRLRAEGHVDGEAARVRTLSGAELWALVSARSLELDGRPCVLMGLTDVTRQKELEGQLVQLAARDDLTHAFNRRHFVEVVEREISRSTRSSAPLSLCMLDADHFKRVNDEHGHFVGDRALCALVSSATSVLRPEATLARMGGEEFAILLPDADVQQACRVAERVRRAVEKHELVTDGGVRVGLTVSLGVAQHVPGESLEALLRAADAALYRAKDGGRNRVAT